MLNRMKGNQQHLTLDDRIRIQTLLERGLTFREIGKRLRKDPTTISKEVKKHRHRKPDMELIKNGCLLRRVCTRVNVCGLTPACTSKCVTCNICTQHCSAYRVKTCAKIDNPPYVCNGCEERSRCNVKKTLYLAEKAHKDYRQTLSESRQGIDLDAEQLEFLNEKLSPLIQKGQSIAHVYMGHAREIPFCSRTLYNYVNQSLFDARNIDLPRKVRFKPRKRYKPCPKSSESLNGRRYEDFNAFVSANPDVPILEMDTIEGRKGGKVILTMHFRASKVLLGFLLETQTQKAVRAVFDWLEEALTTEVFRELFPVILTDNGSEFSNPFLLEQGISGEKRTQLFYCDPYCSWQKGGVEKNHQFVRYIVPKGTSFDELTNEDITVMMSHINSLARNSLNNVSPFQAASPILEQLFQVLMLKEITRDSVHLKPELLKK